MPAPDYTHTRLADLLKIRERPSDYMPEAYEAAEKELASRKPDADILSKAQRELEIWKASEESRNQHVEAVDGKPDQIKDYFLYISQQIKEKPFSAHTIFIYLALLFASGSVLIWVSQFDLFMIYLNGADSNINSSLFLVALPLFAFPVGIVLWWYHDAWTWFIWALYGGFAVLLGLTGLLYISTFFIEEQEYGSVYFLFESAPPLDSIATLILYVFIGGSIWSIIIKYVFDLKQKGGCWVHGLNTVLVVYLAFLAYCFLIY